MLSLLATAIVLGQSNPFQAPIPIAEPDRLALTPKIDGQISVGEWDSFSSDQGRETYFQWEPYKVHAAAQLKEGEELVLSLDVRGNGWLIGKDNVEIRARMAEGGPVLSARVLDGTITTGPQWIEMPELVKVAQVAASKTDSGWFVEFSVTDPGLELLRGGQDDKVGVRLEAMPSGAVSEPFWPRTMVVCKFGYERGSNLPGGLKWATQLVSRDVAMGGRMKIRFTFNGSNDLGLKRIDLESKGLDAAEGAKFSLPFPGFDRKGRTFVDYETPIAEASEPGYRLARAVITDAQGNATFLRSSFRVAPVLELDFVRIAALKPNVNERKQRFAFYVRSNTSRRLQGNTFIDVPEGWRLITGEDKSFILANSRGSVRRVFDAVIPPNAQGLFPVTIRAEVGQEKYSQTVYVRIQP